MTNDAIIKHYIEAVSTRARQVGGGIDYMAGFFESTLRSLKLQKYELENLEWDAKNLEILVKEENYPEAQLRLDLSK